MSGKKFLIADLFSGCGGLTLGFHKTSKFKSVFALDNNVPSIETYCANFDKSRKHARVESIESIIENKNNIPKVDVVIGGPPCQGFSLLNKNRENDDRRELWYHFLQFAKIANSRVIMMENVPQLLDGNEFELIISTLKSLKYNYIVAHVLNSANYGVPQSRKRAIILASREHPVCLPIPTHINSKNISENSNNLFFNLKLKPWVSASVAFEDLPEPVGTEIRNESPPLNLHFGRNPTELSLQRYKAVPPGGNRFDLQDNRPDITPECWLNKPSGSTDLFGRIWWDRPSLTIRTEFFKPEKGRYLHPYKHRPITHREAARLQSFPDEFIFKGSKVEIAKQIGNAVPPLLAESIAKEVSRTLNKVTTSEDISNFEFVYNTYFKEEVKYIYFKNKYERKFKRSEAKNSRKAGNQKVGAV